VDLKLKKNFISFPSYFVAIAMKKKIKIKETFHSHPNEVELNKMQKCNFRVFPSHALMREQQSRKIC
jgi:hypothetical protein